MPQENPYTIKPCRDCVALWNENLELKLQIEKLKDRIYSMANKHYNP